MILCRLYVLSNGCKYKQVSANSVSKIKRNYLNNSLSSICSHEYYRSVVKSMRASVSNSLGLRRLVFQKYQNSVINLENAGCIQETTTITNELRAITFLSGTLKIYSKAGETF